MPVILRTRPLYRPDQPGTDRLLNKETGVGEVLQALKLEVGTRDVRAVESGRGADEDGEGCLALGSVLNIVVEAGVDLGVFVGSSRSGSRRSAFCVIS